MVSAWIEHVKDFREKNPSVSYKEALKQAKASYSKVLKNSKPSRPKSSDSSKPERIGSGIAENVYLASLKKMGVTKGLDKRFKGELHAPLLLEDGTLAVGNYIGPQTEIKKRVARGDKGITGVDELSRRHDALYSLAKSKKDIRDADIDFLNIIKRKAVRDNPMNLKTGKTGIASKFAAESIVGVRFPTNSELSANDPNDPMLLQVVADTDKTFGVTKKGSGARSVSGGCGRCASRASVSKKRVGGGLRLSGEGLKLSGEGLKLGKVLNSSKPSSGEGILDQLQKMVDWIFGSNKKGAKQERQQESKPEPVKETCKQILEKYGIVDKKTFRKWALKHHPDKQAKDPETQAAANELFAHIKNCMESEQVGQGFSLANFKKAVDKYGKISKDLGVKPEDAIKDIKAKAKEKGLSFGSGQSGSGFWDFLSVLSVLPIPFISDVARTISLVATPIRVATGSFTPALDGMVTDTMKEIASIFPKELQDTLFKPASAFAESVGFGLKQAGQGSGVTPMQKVQALYAMVKKIDDAAPKILKLEPKTRDKMINMRKKTKDVADYIMGKLGATAVSMPDPYAESAYSRAH